MTALAEAPNVSSLTDRAMLVDLTIRQWQAGKTDKTATAKVSESFGSSRRMGHFYKRLLNPEHLSDIRTIAASAYKGHLKRTLPWFDNGQRVLSSDGYFDYMEMIRQFRSDFESAVDLFMDHYRNYIFEARTSLSILFNEDEYPQPDRVRDKFGFEVTVLPLPSGADFRVPVLDQDEIRQMIDGQVTIATQKATDDLVDRIKTTVGHMSERLRAYSGTREGSFRDTLVENMQELVGLIPSLNITGDEHINEIHTRMSEELCIYSPDDLRKDEDAREATAKAADDILKRMKEYF